jgi:stage II sporulation protein D
MRQLIVLLATLALATGVASASSGRQAGPAVALSAPVFVLTGGGYGHGVGMSQYGAFAQATAGRTYRDILSFYYPGTEIGKAPVAKVRVLVADGRSSLHIGSTAPFQVLDAAGTTVDVPAGELVLRPDLEVRVDGVAARLAGPLLFRPGKGATLTLDGTGYRGELRATVVQGRLQVIDHVGLDAYLLGVVPGEVPKEWPAETLRAQAVAARSYALATMVRGREWDLYADTRSQAYYGVGQEAPSTSAAVSATRGQVVTFAGKIATTFYYSSSGGRTAASEDVFGVTYGYLQAFDDPWDTASPFHRWEPRVLTAGALAKTFGLSSPVIEVEAVPTPSGRPATVTLTTRDGSIVQLRASDVRARLGLRSTAFRLGVLQLRRPSAVTVAGTRVQLGGIARDVDGAVLEKLGPTGGWIPAARLTPAPDGSFTVSLRPAQTSTYRLSAAGLPGPALTLTVAPGTTG